MKNACGELWDFHAHILPGADHGSSGADVSLAQLELLKYAGVGFVVATPHFYPERESAASFLIRREKSVLLLRESMIPGYIYPEVFVGAEVLVCPRLDTMPDIEQLCISGTRTILLELPDTSWGENVFETVTRFFDSGFSPVLAHPGRYPSEKVDELLRRCAIQLQLNAGDCLSFSGRSRTKKYFAEKKVAAVGSDIHGADMKSARRLAAFYKKYGTSVIQNMNSLLSGAVSLSNFVI